MPISLRFVAKNTPLKISAPIEALLTIWYDHNLKKHTSRTTHVLRKDVAQLKRFRAGYLFKGTEFEKKETPSFDSADFERSVESFAVIATHTSYWPEDKKKLKSISVGRFLYNPRAPKIRSWFLYCLENEPRLLGVEEVESELTQAMMDVYIEEIGEGLVFDLSPEQIRHFNKGTRMAEDVFKKNTKLPKHWIDSPRKKAELIFNAIYTYYHMGDKILHPGWFSNPLTYNKTLIEYLKVKMANNVIPMQSTYRYR